MARCPFAIWQPVPSHSGPLTAQLGAVMHVTTNHGDPYNYFDDPNHAASSHFWIADDGSLKQYVDTDFASWAQAGGNHEYVSVETSGTPDQPMTSQQVATFAELYHWGHHQHGWPYQLADTPGTSGLGWHGMGGAAWGGHFDCPGDLRKAQRGQVIDRASQLDQLPPAPPPGQAWEYQEAEVRTTLVLVGPLGAANSPKPGCGFANWDPGLGRDPVIVGFAKQGPDPTAGSADDKSGDPYWQKQGNYDVKVSPRGGKACVAITDGTPGSTVGVYVSVA